MTGPVYIDGPCGEYEYPITSFFVHGVPQPQGSSRAFVVNGRPVITSTNKNLKSWRDLVAMAAQEHAIMYDCPVMIIMSFYMPRPKSLPKKVFGHTKKPDLDKLIRSVSDALTGVMYRDDSCLVDISATKEYADEEMGVRITLREAWYVEGKLASL